jgi:c-di-AMP phosphodiesterase-like protein
MSNGESDEKTAFLKRFCTFIVFIILLAIVFWVFGLAVKWILYLALIGIVIAAARFFKLFIIN